MKSEKKVQYQLKKSSRRRTVSIKVLPSGEVKVYAPSWVREPEIRRIVEKKETWIRGHQERFRTIYRDTIYRRYLPGEIFLVFGEPYTLHIDEQYQGRIFLDIVGGRIIIGGCTSAEKRKKQIREFYRELGKQYTDEHMEQLTRKAGSISSSCRMPQELRFRSMNRRWGSCSSGQVLTLSLRLFGAPPELIDYVMVHELVHLYHFHHQGEFYGMMEKLVPNWKELKDRLEQMSGQLVL